MLTSIESTVMASTSNEVGVTIVCEGISIQNVCCAREVKESRRIAPPANVLVCLVPERNSNSSRGNLLPSSDERRIIGALSRIIIETSEHLISPLGFFWCSQYIRAVISVREFSPSSSKSDGFSGEIVCPSSGACGV